MTNPRSCWRYSCRGRRESGRERRVRSSNQRDVTAVHHHNPLRDENGRVIHATGWVDTERLEGYAPEATAPSNQLVDIKETDMDCDGGWGTYPVDKNVSAGAWESRDTTTHSDWSKPPQIQSVEQWDDSGARDTWNIVIVGLSPLNNPDLYVEKNIDWDWKIPADLLTYIEYGCAAPPRHGNPMLLGLETLAQNRSTDTQLAPRNDNMINSKKNLQHGGDSLGSWGENPQNGGGRGSIGSWRDNPQQGGGSLGSWGEKPQEAGGGSLGSWEENPQQGGGSLGSWGEKPQNSGRRGSIGSWGDNPQQGGGSLGSWGEKPPEACGGSLGNWGENPQQGGGSLGSWG